RDADGNLTSITLLYQNGGSQKARGIDFTLAYQLPTSVGTFTSLTQASFLDSFQFAALPGEPERELAGSGSDEGYLKWRANSTLWLGRAGLHPSKKIYFFYVARGPIFFSQTQYFQNYLLKKNLFFYV